MCNTWPTYNPCIYTVPSTQSVWEPEAKEKLDLVLLEVFPVNASIHGQMLGGPQSYCKLSPLSPRIPATTSHTDNNLGNFQLSESGVEFN